MKKMSMQEFANQSHLYVAKDIYGNIQAFAYPPVFYKTYSDALGNHNTGWTSSSENGTGMDISGIVEDSHVIWEQSLCVPEDPLIKESSSKKMKPITMQEFANTFNSFVAKDGDDAVYAYEEEPVIVDNDMWESEKNSIEITTLVETDPDIAWDACVYKPQIGKDSAEVFSTPCGAFRRGETVIVRERQRIFYSYDKNLLYPFSCVNREYEDEFLNGHPFLIEYIPTGKKAPTVQKIPDSEFVPFTEYNPQWYGKLVLRKILKTPQTIVGSQYGFNGEHNVVISDKENHISILTMEDLLDKYTWYDGTECGIRREDAQGEI